MFENANDFSLYIETTALGKSITVLDAILMYCEDNVLDPYDIRNLVNESLKSKLELCFIDMNYLPKQSLLEFI